MPPSQQTFDNGDEKLPPALLKVDGAAGGGGRKAKTRAGAGNTGDGGAARIFSGPEDRDPGRSVLHRHLKDIAVDALELAQG